MAIELSGTVIGETLRVEGLVNNNTETLSTSLIPDQYFERMNSYYPQVIGAIDEFKAIIKSEYPEFELLNNQEYSILDDAYLLTMGKVRIEQWEKILGITPIDGSTVGDRRDTIIARIRAQGKLNTASINAIVNAFTGGKARSWVANSCLYVEITPPPNNKSYQFKNVEQELKKKIPAHLGYNIKRAYFTWGDIYDDWDTWGDVYENFDTWNDVYLYVPWDALDQGVVT